MTFNDIFSGNILILLNGIDIFGNPPLFKITRLLLANLVECSNHIILYYNHLLIIDY